MKPPKSRETDHAAHLEDWEDRYRALLDAAGDGIAHDVHDGECQEDAPARRAGSGGARGEAEAGRGRVGPLERRHCLLPPVQSLYL